MGCIHRIAMSHGELNYAAVKRDQALTWTQTSLQAYQD